MVKPCIKREGGARLPYGIFPTKTTREGGLVDMMVDMHLAEKDLHSDTNNNNNNNNKTYTMEEVEVSVKVKSNFPSG